MRSRSILTGSCFWRRSRRWAMPLHNGYPPPPRGNAVGRCPSTTLAVCGAAPGMVSISSMVFGTLPPNSETTFFAAPTIRLGLVVEEAGAADIAARTWGAPPRNPPAWVLANRPGVTSFTRLSVHWAERMVATSNSQGFDDGAGAGGCRVHLVQPAAGFRDALLPLGCGFSLVSRKLVESHASFGLLLLAAALAAFGARSVRAFILTIMPFSRTRS